LFDWMIPTIIPKIPRAEAKISTMRILTKSDSSCASERAHELPAIPTEIPLAIFVNPTLHPDQNTEYPAK
jgi:hypothetical protein